MWEAVPPPPPPSPPPAPANASANGTTSEGAGNATDAGSADVADSSAAGGAAAPAPAPAEAAAAGSGTDEPPKLRKRTVKVPLNITGGFAAAGMNKSELAASSRVLRRLRAADQAKRELAKARNDLEAYIIATRDKVGAAAGTEGQRAGAAHRGCLLYNCLRGTMLR